MNDNCSAIILAGGKSTRMGFDKSALELGGEKLLKRHLDMLSALCSEVLIVADSREKFAGLNNVRIEEDLLPEAGPLAGIMTGLKVINGDSAFVTACDMPFLKEGLVKRLIEAAGTGEFQAIVARGEKGPEPLCAIYRSTALGTIEDALGRGERSIQQVIEGLDCLFVDASPDEQLSFFNVNRPEDLEEMKRIIGKGSGR